MAKHDWIPSFGSINSGNPNHVKDWRTGMDWARLEVDHNTLKDEFISWAESFGLDNTAHYQMLPSWHYVTIGRIAYLINRGAEPTEDTMKWFLTRVEELNAVKVEATVSESNDDEVPLTTRTRKIVDYVNFYSFIDAVITRFQDDGEKIEEMITDRFRRFSPNRIMLKKLYVHFKDSLADAIAERDNPHVEKRIAPLILAVNILAAASGNAKVAGYKGTKADRKAVKAAENVVYKTMDADTNMASVNPAQIPGMTVAVIYNAKNRKAMVYTAKKDEVLGIKGTKITGFDEATSFAKTLRKPKVLLPMFRNASTTRRIEVLFADINGKNHPVNGRISKDMVIVKVLK